MQEAFYFFEPHKHDSVKQNTQSLIILIST